MSMKRVGSTEQYAQGWEKAFGKKAARSASPGKSTAKKKIAKSSKKKRS